MRDDCLVFSGELPDSRLFYWPQSSYHCAWQMLLGWPWAGVKSIDGGKATVVFSAVDGFFDCMFEHGLSEALDQAAYRGIAYHDFDGVTIRVVMVHGCYWAAPSDVIAASQLLSGYWVISTRKCDLYAPSVSFCWDNGRGTAYWFVRDLVRGLPRMRCEICGKKHQRLQHPTVFNFWRLEGLDLVFYPVDVYGGSDCQNIAREKQRESYFIARKQLDQTKEQLKCLSQGRKQLREIRRLLRPQSPATSQLA